MLVNIDNIAGDEKTIAAKENIKVTYKRLMLDCYVFIMKTPLTRYKLIFSHSFASRG